MALYYDLPVFKDTYALTLKIFELTQNFSREYKFTLGQDMKRDCPALVSIKQQSALAVIMDGIGKQITGWRNSFHYLLWKIWKK